MAKFTFDTIQPYVEMLIDAIENKGSSSSGFPYNKEVSPQAIFYRNLLTKVRNKEITKQDLCDDLRILHLETIRFIGNNQAYRIEQILKGLDYFMHREYNKYNN